MRRDLKKASISRGVEQARFERRGRVAQYFQACAENIDVKVTRSLIAHKENEPVMQGSFFVDVIKKWTTLEL